MTSTIKILIADDHTLFRQGVLLLLESIEEMQVVGEAGDGSSVIEMARRTQPDVILMDIQMPHFNGIDATRKIIGTAPETRILILTMFEDDDSVFAAMRAGAMGYILKGAKQEELLRAIRAVANGEGIFSPSIAQRVMNFFSSARRHSPAEELPELTPREIEVLDLIAKGKKNRAIADYLVISPKTVRNHISSIFQKLQVSERSEAIKIAREVGLGDKEDSQ